MSQYCINCADTVETLKVAETRVKELEALVERLEDERKHLASPAEFKALSEENKELKEKNKILGFQIGVLMQDKVFKFVQNVANTTHYPSMDFERVADDARAIIAELK